MKNAPIPPSLGQKAENPRAGSAELRSSDLELLGRYVQAHVELVPQSDLAARTLIGNIAVTIRRTQTAPELGRYVLALKQLHDALRDAPATLRKASAQADCS